MRGPGFKWAVSQTTFCGQLKCVLRPTQSCLQRARVWIPKIKWLKYNNSQCQLHVPSFSQIINVEIVSVPNSTSLGFGYIPKLGGFAGMVTGELGGIWLLSLCERPSVQESCEPNDISQYFANILTMLPYMIGKIGPTTWRSLLKFVYRRRTQAFMDWLGFAEDHWGAGLMQCFNSALYNICMPTVIRAHTCFQ